MQAFKSFCEKKLQNSNSHLVLELLPSINIFFFFLNNEKVDWERHVTRFDGADKADECDWAPSKQWSCAPSSIPSLIYLSHWIFSPGQWKLINSPFQGFSSHTNFKGELLGTLCFKEATIIYFIDQKTLGINHLGGCFFSESSTLVMQIASFFTLAYLKALVTSLPHWLLISYCNCLLDKQAVWIIGKQWSRVFDQKIPDATTGKKENWLHPSVFNVCVNRILWLHFCQPSPKIVAQKTFILISCDGPSELSEKPLFNVLIVAWNEPNTEPKPWWISPQMRWLWGGWGGIEERGSWEDTDYK